MNTMTDEITIKTYLETKDNFFLEKLIQKYLPLIKSILSCYKIPKQDYEDYYQDILVQFIQLVNKYSSETEINFESYIKTELKRVFYNFYRRKLK